MSRNTQNRDSALNAAGRLERQLAQKGLKVTVGVDGNKGSHNWQLRVHVKSGRSQDVPSHFDHFQVVVKS